MGAVVESDSSQLCKESSKTPKPRSPRSQREACNRLSQPRKPKKTEAENIDADEDVLEYLERFEHLDDEEMEEILANGSDTPAVQIIPSMLAQCSPRLERIEEEAEGPRRARETKARAKALGLQGLLPGSRGLMRHRFAPEDMSSEWKASIAHEVLPKTNVMSSA